jgi:hypothetical protein
MKHKNKVEEVRKCLTPVEYWEWRTTIAELNTEKQNYYKTEMEFKLLQKDAEIHAVRMQLFQRTRMDAVKDALRNAQAEYERFTGVLEKSLGQSLKNKVIDDVTFEVKELPDETNKPAGNGHNKE